MNQQEIINIIDIFAPLGEGYQMTNKEAIEAIKSNYPPKHYSILREALDKAIEALEQTEWILCSERLPNDMQAVNITWCNRNPVPYYADIKDVPFVSTGCFFHGRWYWWSVPCEDNLSEYGDSEFDRVDAEIEILAWQPLPEPYRGE